MNHFKNVLYFALRPRTVLLNLLFIFAFILSIWSASIFFQKQTKPKQSTFKNMPDAFMEDVVAIILNKGGTPALKIQTPKMIHYPETDATFIQSPRVTLFRKSPEPWYIQSHFAKTNQGINEIKFLEEVIIHHPADSQNPLTTLKTNSLTVLPKQQIAETKDPITITQPDAIVHAKGMLANLQSGTIKLLSEAQGEYAPPS